MSGVGGSSSSPNLSTDYTHRSTSRTDSDALLFSFLVGLASLALIWVLFEFLRWRLPRVYYYRWFLSQYPEALDVNEQPVYCPPLPSARPLGWLWPVLRTDIDSMLPTHGIDAVLFLRFLRSSMCMFTMLSVGTAAFLMPIYATGPNKNLPVDNPQFVSGLNTLSIANLQSRDARLWATLVADIICTAIIYFFSYHDYKSYVYLRRKFKQSEEPSNYCAVVTDIPRSCMNECAVKAFFEQVIPGSVAKVMLGREASQTRRKLNMYNKELARKLAALHRMETDPRLRGRSPTVVVYRDEASPKGLRVRSRKVKLNAVEYHSAEMRRLKREVLQEQEEMAEDVMPLTNGAVVLFKTKVAAAIATQVTVWKTSTNWDVQAGWDPGAINWPKFNMSSRQRKPVTIAGNLFIVFLTVAWGLVITTIQALNNLTSLGKLPALSFLNAFVQNAPPLLVSFVQGVLPPLILMLLLRLIPLLFRLVIHFQKIPAQPVRERKLRNFYYVFLIFSNFVYVIVSGTILQQLAVILVNPSSLIQQLAVGIPQQALFTIKYVLLNGLIGYPLYIIDPGKLFIRGCMYSFATHTQRLKRQADRMFSHFIYFKFYALSMMISLLGHVYVDIAPLINPVTALYFLIGFVCCKYKLLYMKHHMWSPNGYWQHCGTLHDGCFLSVLAAMVIHQVSLVVIFGIYEAFAQAVISAVFVIITLYFIIAVHNKFSTLARHGSLAEIVCASRPPPPPGGDADGRTPAEAPTADVFSRAAHGFAAGGSAAHAPIDDVLDGGAAPTPPPLTDETSLIKRYARLYVHPGQLPPEEERRLDSRLRQFRETMEEDRVERRRKFDEQRKRRLQKKRARCAPRGKAKADAEVLENGKEDDGAKLDGDGEDARYGPQPMMSPIDSVREDV